MSEDMTELRQKVAEIERKTAIWRSQVAVLLLVFLAGWFASSLWMKARLEARVTTVEGRVGNVEADAIKKAKVVESQAFVLKTEDGREIASLRKKGPSARLELKSDVLSMTVSDDSLVICDLRPKSAAELALVPEGYEDIFASIIADKKGHLSFSDQTGGLDLSDLTPRKPK